MNKRLKSLTYALSDFITAALGWTFLYLFRKLYLEPQKFGYSVDLTFGDRFYVGLALVPLFWIILYFVSGYYTHPFRKSRLKEIFQTLYQSVIGVIIIFFILLLDDVIASYKGYYQALLFYFAAHFLLTYIPRFIISTSTVRKIHKRKLGFNTLIIGSNEKALELYEELEASKVSSGFNIKGFVHIRSRKMNELQDKLPHLGYIKNIRSIIQKHNIEEVIIAIESSEHDKIRKILNFLQGENVYVKIIPDLYNILSGQVKMNSILGVPLIEINQEIIPQWQWVLKRILDISVSLSILIIFSWLYLIIALTVKLTSKGPIFYSHKRIGKGGKPFSIYKFRSMYVGAEKSKPMLATDNDPRVTPFGRFMRKTRLDEMPQFYNVLIGDMSLVGPRPERQFFIDQIIKKAPHYTFLHRVRPGITSWGQVKYGYAENVDEMVERLKYDIIYIENMSILVDIKILIHTILTVLQGRGK